MDFNVGKMAATIYVQRGRVWHAVAGFIRSLIRRDGAHLERALPGASFTRLSRSLRRFAKSVDTSVSDIAVLRQAGFPFIIAANNPICQRPRAGHEHRESFLFVIAQTCPVTTRCLRQQA